MIRFREWAALKIAPWLYIHRREEREEAFRDLAVIAYGSRDAVWTSPGVLVKSALRHEAAKYLRKWQLGEMENRRLRDALAFEASRGSKNARQALHDAASTERAEASGS